MFLISSRKSLRQNLIQKTEEAAFLVSKAVFTEAFLREITINNRNIILESSLSDTNNIETMPKLAKKSPKFIKVLRQGANIQVKQRKIIRA